GFGAGAADSKRGYVDSWNVMSKVCFEYGLITCLVFMVFTVTVFIRNAPSLTVAVGLLVAYLFLSGSFLSPIIIYWCYFLSAGYVVAGDIECKADGAMTDDFRFSQSSRILPEIVESRS